MALTEIQTGVLRGISIGMACSAAIVILGAWINPLSYPGDMTTVERIAVAIQLALLPTAFLVVSVGRQAKHRFFSREDVDGSIAGHEDTDATKYLQSLLQNTLEQCAIAFAAYLAWAVVMPARWLSVIALAACCFAVGRVLFFRAYSSGAPARALGFSLTFYPSLLMLVAIALMLLWRGLT